MEEKEIAKQTSKIELKTEELMVMNEFIKNLDVSFEIVSPIKELDFVISSAEIKQIEVIESIEVRKEEQTTFSFELPLFKPQPVKKEEIKTQFEINNEVRDIQVNDPVQFVPITELTDAGIIRHTLEEYTEIENILLESKSTNPLIEEVTPEDLNITLKKIDVVEEPSSTSYNISPIDMTIEESMKLRTEERRKKLKDFNYKFNNSISKIEELESVPAYKRQNIDLTKSQQSNSNSRISVGTDSNDDLQLRSNNSFLHDNVD